MVVVLAVGTADEAGGHTGDGGDLLVAGGDVRHHLIGGEGVVVVVVEGVVHDLMPGVVEGLHGLRVLIHPVTHHEEGGLDVVFAQNVNEHLSVLVAPCGVEADGTDLLLPLHRVDGKLSLGGGGADEAGASHDHENTGGHQRRQDQQQRATAQQ